MTLDDLERAGFDIDVRNHALAVLEGDFSDPLAGLCETLIAVEIEAVDLIESGGGEARSTRRLRRALTRQGWNKRRVTIRKIVDDQQATSITHEIDHFRRTDAGALALEIEWNNKDPFFDRDLENFQRLHAERVISVGIVVTRGASLQDNLRKIVADCALDHGVREFEDIERIFDVRPTRRQREAVRKRMSSRNVPFTDAWPHIFTADKFGAATTHWSKLMERLIRGVGNPCPLLSIGIPASAVKR